jgi:hypothetical protein
MTRRVRYRRGNVNLRFGHLRQAGPAAGHRPAHHQGQDGGKKHQDA